MTRTVESPHGDPAWHTLHAAFNSLGTTSTEAEEDPMHEPTPGGAA